MKKAALILAVLFCLSAFFPSCSQNTEQAGDGTGLAETVQISTDFQRESDEMFTERDIDGSYDSVAAVNITLDGNRAAVSGSGAAYADGILTIGEEGTYLLTGVLEDGSVVVDAPDSAKVQIVLCGAIITSHSSAAIYVKSADKVFLTLARDSENSLASGDSFVAIDENNIDATVFSKQDLTLNGEGSLTVSAPAGHGVVSKDDLVLSGAKCTVTAAYHALDANNSIRINESALTLAAGKDGIHCEHESAELGYVYIQSGSIDISAEGDGISASAHMQINGGEYKIVAGGGHENAAEHSSEGYGQMPGGMGGRPGGIGSHGGMNGGPGSMGGRAVTGTADTDTSSDSDSTSMKGIKAGASLLIAGGEFSIDSADDALHSNTSVIVEDGSFKISAGDDALHADEVLRISGGSIAIDTSYEGLEALNVEVLGGDITIVASDDGINAAGGNDGSGFGGMRPGGDAFGGFGGAGGSSASKGSITVAGGNIYMNASGDGVDANGSFTMSGGRLTICGPTVGDTAVLDYDSTATITGGTFIGTGASQMAQTFSSSGQGVISVSVGNQSAGTQISVSDKNGNILLSDTPKLSFGIVIVSCPQMEKEEKYTLTVGSATEEFEAE